ncbi:MAG: LCP family protein [Anaerolineae bacterium]|nr:LCP family protein [Candidatus Roseilinea sp.]MDW8448989.1 LCP family protein [Anaerolineae bacterium]
MLRKPFIIGLIVFGLIAAAIGASFYAYHRAYEYFANELPILPEILNQPRPVVIATPSTSQDEIIVLPQAWDGKERVNILLLGIDQRAGDSERAYRTDTMIVFTLDPVTMEAGILSIPRDVWVPIPGNFDQPNYRINQANFLGDAFDYPGGGIALARKTVENFLGIPIHFVVRINFTAFESFIDRIGGITIDVPEPIYDPEYPTEDYGVEVFSLPAGLQTMDGATALKYARTRHSRNGDFDRARRQQQVILAVREKLKNPQTLALLIAGAPDMLRELSSSIKTDMTLDQMQQLAVLAQKIERDKIKSEVLDQRYTEFATTPDGSQVIIPVRARIAELRERFFSSQTGDAAEIRSTTP